MSQIPASIDAVSNGWLTDVLHTAGALPAGATVTGHTATQIGQGVGLMGDIFRVTPTYGGDTGGAPDTVVVKLPSQFEANRAQGIGLGMYEAECRFYSELGPRTPSGLPVVHRSEIVPGTAEFVIVMEDLGRLSQVDQADRHVGGRRPSPP